VFLLTLLVAVVGVYSLPARKFDLAEELLNEVSEGDINDEVDVKTEGAKKDEVAGSGAGAKKATIAEEKKDNPESDESESPASGEEDDDVPKEDTVEASGSGDVEEKSDGNEVAEDPNVDQLTEEASKETAEASEESAPATYETETASVNEEFEEEQGEKRDQVATEADKRSPYGGGGCGCGCGSSCGCGHGCGHHGGCHNCHEHGGGCHEGCCCEHEGGHHHGHHEHEDCCHHHGHHHGFVHEWGEDCCGGHHEHDCCGHHTHGHNCCHEQDHGCCGGHHDHHDHGCGHHGGCGCGCGHGGGGYGGGGYGGGYGGHGGGYGGGGYGGGYGRANIPVGYHCHDMVSKNGEAKSKRFCVPVYGFPEYSVNTRDTIARPVKKQTVHVGYGYASGDNYRLGYQEGGMGGLASSFTGQIQQATHDENNNFNKRSYFARPLRRHYDGIHGGYGPYGGHGMMHGGATPYGHPVTHPGFTTMGYPGHALASQDVRFRIPHPVFKREADDEEEPEFVPLPEWGEM